MEKASVSLTIPGSFFKILGLDFFVEPSIIDIVEHERDRAMKQFNPIALELRSGKYKQRIIKNKKKYDRKRIKQEKY